MQDECKCRRRSALDWRLVEVQIEIGKILLVQKEPKPTSNSLQFARTRGHKEIEKILIDAGAKE